MAKTLICGATSFGYGPIAKLLAIARVLQSLNYQLIFLGNGTALELARYFPFEQCIEYDISNVEHLSDLGIPLEGISGIINVLEPVLAHFAQNMSLPHFYIDSLFWMWHQIDVHTANADIYFIQRFPGVEEKLARWRDSIHNPRLVGPIVESSDYIPRRDQRGNHIIINYAGLESGLVDVDRGLLYPYVLTALLMPILQKSAPFHQKIVFTGNQRVMFQLEQQFPQRPANVQFTHLSHDAFLKILASSSLLVTSPGLTTTYEAFLSGIPVRFLPPQNYSQTLMLDYYRREGLADISFHWNDVYADYAVSSEMEESVAVRQVLSVIDRFSQDPQAQQQAMGILSDLLNTPTPPNIPLRQLQFARSMGKLAAHEVAITIDTALKTIGR